MRLYGKDTLRGVLDKTAKQNRLSHAVLFSGKSGVGKKMLARYTAELMLCENNACGECACCRNIENDTHPDVIFAKRQYGGKYSMETLRSIRKESVTLPNNGRFKVFIFEDCDSMLAVHFNTLLKLIEEPAEHLRFIFTCMNTALIPETIMSRVTEYEVPEPTVEDCERFLIDTGTDKEKALELSEEFAGNIGECVNFLNGGDARINEAAKKISAAIASRNAYSAMSELSALTGKSDFYRVFDCLVNVFRDAMAIKYGQSSEYPDKASAGEIAKSYTEQEILRLSDKAFEIMSNEIYNVNPALGASYFVCEMMNRL